MRAGVFTQSMRQIEWARRRIAAGPMARAYHAPAETYSDLRSRSRTRILLLAPFIVALLLVPSEVQGQSWYNPNWLNRQKITISPALADADLTNFPYLVKITDPANPVFASAQADGDDILFTASDGTAKLDHEIETYDAGGTSLITWVRIPLLSSSIDTEIYLYYGYGSASNQHNPTSAWDSDFVMVQHLDETSGTHFDATVNDNDGAPVGGLVQTATGRINGADAFSAVHGVCPWVGRVASLTTG